ncbi:MAG: hypothetical protein J6S23_02305 [Clostridia bacterium]|nr:hypothetical protein [Clostridia bacterium]
MKNKIKLNTLLTKSILVSIIILLLSLIGIVVCFVFKSHILDLILTISGGIFTGIIMYWLSNIRQTYLRKLEHEQSLMLKLQNLCNQNVREIDYFINRKELIDDFNNFFLNAFNKMEEAQTILFDNMPYELFCCCCFDKENPINYSATNNLFDDYQNVKDIETEILPLLYKLSQMQKSTSEKLKKPIEEHKNKIDACYKFGL